ncbi:MAG TPA: lysophospholipid acyltransferase family protein [Casimicrobiaceae bacterium]|jgi:1-acyl-sn-glycerol-3-phosphate acyltransferase|nr:lysophospholipid acyltransferase family protein [Casimicrobiaceae bacterium]
MSALRSLAFALVQSVGTAVYAVLVLLLFWLPPLPRFRFIIGWCWLNLFAARWICGIRHRVVGAENIPPASSPHIVLSKHSSTWETLELNFLFPPLAFVAKKELLSLPFFGWAFKLASPIIIDRKAGKDAMAQMVEQGRERLAQGFWIVIYPEGTRIRAGTRARYKTGGARLAIALGVPVVPVAHNAGYLWPKGVFGKRPGTVTVSIGKPITVEGADMQGLMSQIERWIEDEVARLGNPLQPGATPP